MSARPPVADAAERERALDPARSFIVQAPAGSGKTELLVRRFVRLLQTVERPEEVLAITFTRKAAAEMKKRVLAALQGADIAAIAPRLRIMTIDSLCTALTRQMPVLSRFGAQPAVAEGEEARQLHLLAAGRVLAQLERREAGAGLAQQVATLLRHLDNDVPAAQALLAGMLARRDQWLRQAGAPPGRAELEATLAAERGHMLERARRLLPGADEVLAAQLLTKKGEWRKRPPAPPELAGNEPLRVALAELLALPPARYTDEQWAVLEAILALLKRAAAELKLAFGERGLADFTEFAQAAVAALGSADDPTDLLLRMDAGLRHILVDEFQDTSVSQWQLLERLTAGWEPGDGRTVFAVGDPMQSIYRFREAEVALFMHARRNGLGTVHLEALTLRTNFRSQAGIVGWVNSAFAQVLPAMEDEAAGAVPYSAAVAHPDKVLLPGAAVTWTACSDRDRDRAREDEARQVVERVRAAFTRPGASCAILVRNRLALAAIVPALQQAGLPFRAVDIEKLGERQVVQDLFALTRALLHAGDRIAWLALLRARWCGLTLADLHALAGCEDEPRHAQRLIWELLQDESHCARLTPDGRARLARLRTALAPALTQALRGSLRERIEGAWLALGGPACAGSASELEDAAIFLARLTELEDAADIADSAVLADSLEDLFAVPDASADQGVVEVMTIHKSKGLEFDTVILPGLDRAPRSGERQLLAWKAQAGAELLLAPVNAADDREEPLYRHVRRRLREAEDLEAGRLLYVAATRARERLHLLGCLRRDHDDTEVPPLRRSLLATLWPVLEDMPRSPLAAPDPAGEPAAARAGMPAGTTHAGRATMRSQGAPLRLALEWRPPELPAAVAAPQPAAPAPGEPVEFSWAGETARHAGSVVHRWLQRMAESALAGWDAGRIPALHAAFARELASLGVSEDALPAAVDRVASALEHALGDVRGRWLLGPQQEAHNEYRVSTREAGQSRQHVIDRSFVDAQGVRWIIDYKSSSHEGGDIEGFLDREQQRYRGQLERYADALPRDRAIRFGLYFPLLGGWREWGERG